MLKNYHLQPEMCSGSYVLALTSLADTDEGFERLFTALQEIETDYAGRESEASIADFIKQVYRKADKCLEPFEAWDREAGQALLSDAEGRIAADFVNLYPPGIPLLVPGERITKEMLENLQMCIERRLYVQGVDKCTNDGNLRIKVVN